MKKLILAVVLAIALSVPLVAQVGSLPYQLQWGEQVQGGQVFQNDKFIIELLERSFPGVDPGFAAGGMVPAAESWGAGWSVASDTTETYILSLANLGGGVALAGSSGNGIIYRSVDSGQTWSVASDTTETHILSLANLGGGVALAGSYPSGIIYRSTGY